MQPSCGHLGNNPVHVLRLLNANAGGRFLRRDLASSPSASGDARQLADHPQAARYDLVPGQPRHRRPAGAGQRPPAQDDAAVALADRHGQPPVRDRAPRADRAIRSSRRALGYFYDEVASARSSARSSSPTTSRCPSNVTYVANGFVSHNTIAFMMDCDTTGIEPDIALIKYKKLVGEGFLKIVNQTVPARPAQARLHARRRSRRSSATSTSARPSRARPRLKPEHLSVFDCAFKPVNGERSIHYMGHVRMMGAIQPFLSGAISKTVNMPEAATAEDIEDVYLAGLEAGPQGHRHLSRRLQALAAAVHRQEEGRATRRCDRARRRRSVAARGSLGSPSRYRRRLPDERRAVTHKFQVAGHEGYITVGLYPDGQPGEIFLKMAKEGSTVSGLMDTLATMTSRRAPVRRAAAGPGQQVRPRPVRAGRLHRQRGDPDRQVDRGLRLPLDGLAVPAAEDERDALGLIGSGPRSCRVDRRRPLASHFGTPSGGATSSGVADAGSLAPAEARPQRRRLHRPAMPTQAPSDLVGDVKATAGVGRRRPRRRPRHGQSAATSTIRR